MSWETAGSLIAVVVVMVGVVAVWARRRLDHRRRRWFRFTFLVQIERTRDDHDDTTTNGHAVETSEHDERESDERESD